MLKIPKCITRSHYSKKTNNTMAETKQHNGRKKTTQWPKQNNPMAETKQHNGRNKTTQWPKQKGKKDK